MIQFIIQMTLPLKVKRSTINNYAEMIDVNWDYQRQTRSAVNHVIDIWIDLLILNIP